MKRREFIAGAGSLATVGLAASVTDAEAFWLHVGRLVAGFVGTTIAGSAARRALLSAGAVRTATKTVQAKTNSYLRSTAVKAYPRNELSLSGRFIAYTAEELGEYGGTSAFDHLFRLNETMEGGQEVSASGQAEPRVLNFSTGTRPTAVPSLQVNYVLSLYRLSMVLRNHHHLEPAAIAGLIYPVEILENNMIDGSWNSYRPTIFSTAFGYVAMRPYTSNDGFYSCDFLVKDIHEEREFTFENVPVERYL